MSSKHRLLWGAAAGALALAAGAAHAQTPQINSSIQQLQTQIELLQQQLKSLQTQVDAQAKQAPAAAPAPVAAAGAAFPYQTSSNGFGFLSADGQYSIGLTGRLHFDVATYPHTHFDPGALGSAFNAGVNARRARLGVAGKFAGDWNYALIYDFGGGNDSTGAHNLENAYITYNGLNHGALPLAFDLGYMDTPFTLDEATSSNNIMFMERAGIQQVVTNLASGDNRSAVGVRSNNNRYWAGIYATGPTFGTNHNAVSTAGGGVPIGAFGRFTYQVIQNDDMSLHLGVDLEGLVKPGRGTAPAVQRQITLASSNPEISVNAPNLLTTGALGGVTTPANGAFVYGFESAFGWRNLFLQGEYYGIQLERANLSANNFNGGYLEGSWTLTGEHRNYQPAAGAYSAINPAHPFSLATGQWGAFELAARFSLSDLNDSQGQPAANAVFGGRETVYGLGLNWYPNTNMRFMLNYLHGLVKKNTGGVQAGDDYDALAMRTQINF